HAHILHRVGNTQLDTVVDQGLGGVIEAELSRFDQPEAVIVVSDARKMADETDKLESTLDKREGHAAVAVMPPYVMSFRLLPHEQARIVLPLQRFRYEIAT